MNNLVMIAFWLLSTRGMGQFRSFCTYRPELRVGMGVGKATFFFNLMGEVNSSFLPRRESSQKGRGISEPVWAFTLLFRRQCLKRPALSLIPGGLRFTI